MLKQLGGAGATLGAIVGVQYTGTVRNHLRRAVRRWKLLEHADGISPDVRVRLEVGQFIAAIGPSGAAARAGAEA